MTWWAIDLRVAPPDLVPRLAEGLVQRTAGNELVVAIDPESAFGTGEHGAARTALSPCSGASHREAP